MSDFLIVGGFLWLLGALMVAMHNGIEAGGHTDRRAEHLRRLWLAPFWPVTEAPRWARYVGRGINRSWREAWGEPVEPRRVRRSTPKPGIWEQPKDGDR